MSQKNRADLIAELSTLFPDNTTAFITPAKLRESLLNQIDSGYVILSDNSGNVTEGSNLYILASERTKLGFIDVTQAVNLDTIETLVASAEQTANKNAANGYAGLDASSQILASQIPAIAITEFLGTVATEVAMLALTGQKGDWCLRSDVGTNFVITGTDPSVVSSWTELSYPASPVVSVNSQVGTVILNSDDISDSGFANKFVTAADITTLANTSGTNTGDQDLSNLVDLTTNQNIGGDKIFTGSTVAASLASFRPVGSIKTASFDISLTAANHFYNVNSSGGDITINVDDSTAPIGTEFEFSPTDFGGNNIIFSGSNGQTINSVDTHKKLDKPFSGSILKKTAVDTWTLIGTLKA